MNDYSEFPPLNLFKRVLRTTPHSAELFVSIWKRKSKSNQISIKKRDIKKIFLTTPTLFRNHLLAIGRLELITFEEAEDYFLIHFNEK